MLLEVKELTKTYKRGNESFSAVDRVNLSVEAGDFISIIGRSGSGKSTLLNMIAGLLRPDSGAIYLEGENILTLNDARASYYRNASVGYIPQGYGVISSLTVLDNVRLPFYFSKRKGDCTRPAQMLLEQTGIAKLAEAYPKQLSGGELKRVSIARALINRPKLLIADEPTSDLDIRATSGIMELLSRISAEGTAVIMVTHELDTVGYGKSAYTMEGGRLI